jgi:hypothetical protein
MRTPAGGELPGAGGEPPGAEGPRRGPVVATCAVIWVAGAVIGVLAAAASGFDHHVIVVSAFILVCATVSPICVVAVKGTEPATLIVAAALGGEIAAAVYAAGWFSTFSRWLIAVEVPAALMASGALYALRRARVPAIPDGSQVPGPAGVALIIVLAPVAVTAGALYGMARYPRVSAAAAVLVNVVGSLVRGYRLWWEVLVAAALAAVVALLPATARRAITWARSTLVSRRESP